MCLCERVYVHVFMGGPALAKVYFMHCIAFLFISTTPFSYKDLRVFSWGWSDSTVSRAHAFYAADLHSIHNIPYDS